MSLSHDVQKLLFTSYSGRLDEVESKLAATDKDADKARKTSKDARDDFNKVKKKRLDLQSICILKQSLTNGILGLIDSTRLIATSRSGLIRSTKI